LVIALICSLLVLVGSSRYRGGSRSWQQRALALLGLLGIVYVGVAYYGVSHYVQYSVYGKTFYMVKGLLFGLLIATLVAVIILPSEKRGTA